MIQNLIVGIIVLACVSYIVWKFALNRKRNVCNGCDKCCNKQKQGGCH
ncbi:MAG: FeoB-associated Cys-rich membrane protein [[Actinobacillus] rossii]|uniref:Virus attachment protein p12 family n=1 Tax=[Actinobacillus] rossii TaxID=123820 RepID=A0A380U352_9PAST|nr:FeoB-associated Cys-rich membrane protein [[Actinobacillus] rossii]MDD7424938.1 FeoB-associated Cys-rich membrane protein [[Actinobacillus] rossii]MDD7570075.1 FeoB-associated Cys-rich membrane protein [[Actinobacillus] rossii]MDY3123123.1 FeoB-associated Cys-rich membrane protein [[Actinobacillus] rossii]MDY4507012.1 FeoB-associated Cys-rich membrane protein [[Actinobacillus] rossii]